MLVVVDLQTIEDTNADKEVELKSTCPREERVVDP
jgi:hypothetical protein